MRMPLQDEDPIDTAIVNSLEENLMEELGVRCRRVRGRDPVAVCLTTATFSVPAPAREGFPRDRSTPSSISLPLTR